jgi:hypothetical protein
VKYWLLNPEGGNQFLNGLEAQPWKSRDSLVSIVGSSSKDQFTLWMELKLFPWLYRRLVQRKKVGTQNQMSLIVMF